MLRLRNPFKHNARVQTTAFPLIRAEFANINWDGGRRTPLKLFLACKKLKMSGQVLIAVFQCFRLGVNCILILFMKK